ncbi:hypothetical protein GW571_14955 (plasmid) [Clavibacter capsici]|uniref:Uncharacterized protein n=1 Tax=Clavibacter capsici TaxID=1874630 RepID=A0AAE7CD33_9MICO|nr:hypothetical protein [Clavibacter capsici]QIS40538.1 hypothetical protein GW572_15270 [Clavibacter capsici]QIS43532.1 hypothetical protein GW571_14955 [Clavibacter capsici]QIS46423.1 hypothetical protein GW570_14605 [Clavibacter capsici]
MITINTAVHSSLRLSGAGCLVLGISFVMLVSAVLIVNAPQTAHATTRPGETASSDVNTGSVPVSVGMRANSPLDKRPGSDQLIYASTPVPPVTSGEVDQYIRDNKSWKSFHRWLNHKFHPVIHLNGIAVRTILGTVIGVVTTATCSQLYLTPVTCTVIGGLLGGVFAVIASSKCGQKGIYIPIPDYWHDWCG